MSKSDKFGGLRTLALLVWFLVAGSGGPLTAAPQSEDAEAQAQIERRVREIFAAAQEKDFTRLESYHLYGPKFTRFSSSSPARLDAAATRQLEHNGLAPLNNLQMRAESLKIDTFANVGIATYILDYSFDVNGEKIHRKERSTLVFVKDGGDWKIVHEHLSDIKLTETVPLKVDTPMPMVYRLHEARCSEPREQLQLRA